MVKNLPAVQETTLRSRGREDPLEEGMATHSSVLAWRIPRTGEPGGLQSTGSDMTEQLTHRFQQFHSWVFFQTKQKHSYGCQRGRLGEGIVGKLDKYTLFYLQWITSLLPARPTNSCLWQQPFFSVCRDSERQTGG